MRSRSVTGKLLNMLAKSNENKTTGELLELDRQRKSSSDNADDDHKLKQFMSSARRRYSVSGIVCPSMNLP